MLWVRLQWSDGRSIEHLPVRRKLGTVAGAIPALLGRVPVYDATKMCAGRGMRVHPSIPVAAHRQLAQTLAQDAAFPDLEILGRLDLARQKIFRKVLQGREILGYVIRKRSRRRPIGSIYGFPSARAVDDQVAYQQSGQRPVRHALARVAGSHEQSAAAGATPDEAATVYRVED